MTDRTTTRISPILALIMAVSVWPSFLLMSLVVYGLRGWLRECRVWHEPPGMGILAFLLVASLVVVACFLNNIRRSARLRRSIKNMPLSDEPRDTALRKTLPELQRIPIGVYPGNTPQAFTAG
ncbi:MAG: hypothetical protein ACU84H_07195 [Gammaproteobacteria bacterium]